MIALPKRFADAEMEAQFLLEYRAAAIRGLLASFFVGASALAAFIGIGAFYYGEFSPLSSPGQAVRVSALTVLVLAVGVFVRAPDFVRRHYSGVVSTIAGVLHVLVGSLGFIYAQSGFDAEARLMMALMALSIVTYALARTPRFTTLLITGIGSVVFFVGISLEPQDDLWNLVVNALLFHGIGFSISIYLESRERELFEVRARELRANRLLEERARELEQHSRDSVAMLAKVSHDLKQPVGAMGLVLGTLERTSDGVVLPGQSASQVEACLAAMRSNLNVVAEFAKLSHQHDSPPVASLSLQDLVARLEQVFQPKAERCGVALVISPTVTAEIPPLASNEGRLWSALANLVDNAIKFSSGSGRPGVVHVSAVRFREVVRISVRDNGIGIRGSNRDAIFRPYFQEGVREQDRVLGMGLGLSIVSRALSSLPRHRIRVESREGVGSCFHVYCPTNKSVITNLKR